MSTLLPQRRISNVEELNDKEEVVAYLSSRLGNKMFEEAGSENG